MAARVYPSQQQTNLTTTGSLLITYEEQNQTTNVSQVECFVNSVERKLIHNNNDNLYSTNLSNGDVVRILITTTSNDNEISVIRRDYTTDDQGGDMGIRNTYITGVTGNSPTTLEVTFTATTISLDYNFEYLVSATVKYPVTPTPTPTVTPTQTPTPTPLFCELTFTAIEQIYPTPTPTNTPTPTITPTNTITPTPTHTQYGAPTVRVTYFQTHGGYPTPKLSCVDMYVTGNSTHSLGGDCGTNYWQYNSGTYSIAGEVGATSLTIRRDICCGATGVDNTKNWVVRCNGVEIASVVSRLVVPNCSSGVLTNTATLSIPGGINPGDSFDFLWQESMYY